MTSIEPQSRILLFVVGMHRSGTSALAASLHDCGATVGDALLPAQDAVNEDGFFEDIRVIETNEKILSALGWTWYAPGTPGEVSWSSESLKALSSDIDLLLQEGFGEGQVQLVKDPRFCITLPLWLAGCQRLGITSRVCTIERPIDAVARSLHKRDAFPISYCQWLCAIYYQHQSVNTPEDAAHITFEHLLEDPVASVRSIIETLALPLNVRSEQLMTVVRKDLNHAGVSSDGGDVEQLVNPEMLREFASAFVERGHELTQIAEQHTHALAVIGERDNELREKVQQLESIGEEHGKALSIIEERDGQLGLANERIQELGEAHGYAISIVEDRDRTLGEVQGTLESTRQELGRSKDWGQQLAKDLQDARGKLGILDFKIDRLKRLPLIGRLFKKYFTYE